MTTMHMLKQKKLKNEKLKFDENRKIKKIKTWYSDGSTELTIYDENNGGWRKQYTFKKEKK